MAASSKLGIVHTGQATLVPTDILTPKELADRLKVPLSWVYRHTDNSRKSRLPVLRCGGFLRFSWPDVCEWLRSNNPLTI